MEKERKNKRKLEDTDHGLPTSKRTDSYRQDRERTDGSYERHERKDSTSGTYDDKRIVISCSSRKLSDQDGSYDRPYTADNHDNSDNEDDFLMKMVVDHAEDDFTAKKTTDRRDKTQANKPQDNYDGEMAGKEKKKSKKERRLEKKLRKKQNVAALHEREPHMGDDDNDEDGGWAVWLQKKKNEHKQEAAGPKHHQDQALSGSGGSTRPTTSHADNGNHQTDAVKTYIKRMKRSADKPVEEVQGDHDDRPSKLLKSESECIPPENNKPGLGLQLRKTKSESSVQSKNTKPLVFFDLEGTSLRPCHITQVGAVCGSHKFNRYVMPKKNINNWTQQNAKLTMRNGRLCYRGNPVDAIPIKQCMEEFMEFLSKLNLESPPLLVAHGCGRFDAPVLVEAAKNVNMLDMLQRTIAGFVDTLPMFRSHCRASNYRQGTLVVEVLRERYDSTHNALDDAAALERLFRKVDKDHGGINLTLYTDSVQYWIRMI